MLHIGCHLSIAKGWARMAEEALGIAADTFQFFSRNPRGSKQKAPNEADLEALAALLRDKHFFPPLAHAPYTMNACSAKPELRDVARDMMRDDLAMLNRFLPDARYVFHPGSHTGQGVDKGIQLVISMLNQVLQRDQDVTVLLETMAGQGSEVGASFAELGAILSGVHVPERLGVCLDTCHVYAAGYDIVTDLEGVLRDFDQKIGLDRLHAVHLNDSMQGLGSHKDRHAVIGGGMIGWSAFVELINHPALRHLPFYLETPNELPGYGEEIGRLRAAYRE